MTDCDFKPSRNERKETKYLVNSTGELQYLSMWNNVKEEWSYKTGHHPDSVEWALVSIVHSRCSLIASSAHTNRTSVQVQCNLPEPRGSEVRSRRASTMDVSRVPRSEISLVPLSVASKSISSYILQRRHIVVMWWDWRDWIIVAKSIVHTWMIIQMKVSHRHSIGFACGADRRRHAVLAIRRAKPNGPGESFG